MSQVNANSFKDANGGSAAVLYGLASPPNSMGFRNRLINGDMRIDQRNAGASVNPTAGNTAFPVDRWFVSVPMSSKLTAQQNAGSVTPPAGFVNYLGVTSSSAYAIASGDIFPIGQRIEGLNVSDLGWGTAAAQAVTLSFWVRSSLTGLFSGNLSNSGSTRVYPFSFTISAANTWEQKTIVVPGDTTGTWLTTNGIGIALSFSMGTGATYLGSGNAWNAGNSFGVTGQVNLVATSGATFYITGVQLEAGTKASEFDRVDYGSQLIQCQRYYEKVGIVFVGAIGASGYPCGYFKAEKRASPTMTILTTGIGTPTVSPFSATGASVTGFYQSGNASTDTNASVSGSAEL